ncbi:hypothetical protein LPJ53_000689 [Coemansia erecta]|uniref:Uncharacterized protein n=1 Tax=Coemansia erecta TaxID=147472 RepID=A0A9W8CUW9_9FUNG|nr:hypothetical protein LPJ53_000689 [Coemansia erecta]
MVSDYNWTSEQNDDGTFAKLSVNGVVLQSYLELLADIQRDALNLSTRVALVKKSLKNANSKKND